MEKDLQTLLEKVVLSEETKEALSAAWNKRVSEVREETSAELREEFAGRFEHDKKTLVSAMEKFLTDRISAETASLVDGQKKLAEERIAFGKKVDGASEKFMKFIAGKLAEEIKEFKGERAVVAEKLAKTEKFIIHRLAEELKEYEGSKTKLIEERVAVESEKKAAIEDAKKTFIEKASSLAEKVISEGLRAEFTQLREELAEARKTTFGRKLFEAFVAEYASHFFNESEEVKKFESKIQELYGQLTDATKTIETKDAELSEAQKRVRMTNELVERKNIMNDLLSPLNKEKKAIMSKLLESVETRKLADSYKKFLPSVLGVHETEEKVTLTETTSGDEALSHEGKRVVDGNRPAKEETEDSQIVELRNLARLPKRV
jgi:hypothetical protein